MSWVKTTLINHKFWLGSVSYPRTEPTFSVTVVVPAWNEEAVIGDTIRSLLAQTYPIKIIVVDDCSTDRTGEIVSAFSEVKLLRTDKNQGSKSRALNCAIPLVDTHLFICVDADTVIEPDGVRKLIMAFNDPETMVASGFVLSKENSNFWQSGRYGEYVVGQALMKSAQQNANMVIVASGCFFAIRTRFLKDHLFSTRTMAEDMDLTWVAIEEGYRVVFVEDAKCFVSDPDTRYLYEKQVSRWFRGLFQNLKVRNYNIFKRSIKLGLVTYGYIFVNLIGIPLTAAAFIWALSVPQFLLTAAVWLLAVLLYSSWRSWTNPFKNLKHGVNMFLLSFYVYWIFIHSAWLELVKNDELKIWTKGH